MGCLLSADTNIMDLLQGEHPKILTGLGYVGYGKSGFRCTKTLISLKCGNIALRLLLRIN